MTLAERYPWRVYRTSFHTGGLLSRHATLAAASRAVRRLAGDCTCGCAAVVAPGAPTPAPYVPGDGSPYEVRS